MLDPFTEYRNWVKTSLRNEKVIVDTMYAISWMEANVDLIDPEILKRNYHPCLAFSKVIYSFLDKARNDTGSFQPIVNWLAENKRCPFGLILKVKALKIMRRSIGSLNKKMIDQLSALQIRSYEMKYRPREYLYLDKLLHDYSLTSRCTGLHGSGQRMISLRINTFLSAP